MALSAAAGLFGQFRQMGISTELAQREGEDQGQRPAGSVSLLAAVQVTLKDGEESLKQPAPIRTQISCVSRQRLLDRLV